MQKDEQKSIPDWVWAVLAVAVVGVTLLLFFSDQSPEPGPSLLYDVSEYEAVEADDVRYHETARMAVDLEHPAGFAPDNAGGMWVVGDTVALHLDAEGQELSRHELDARPHCVAVAPTGRVYLGMRDHVAVMSDDGQQETWKALNERAWITAIVADEDHVFVADAGNARVHRYSHAGELETVIGARDRERDVIGLVVPSHYLGMALDSMSALWVVNPGKLGVEKYRADGALLTEWHQPGFGLHQFPGCCNPIHIAFKSNGALVTAEKGINRVKTFGPDRSFAGIVAAPEQLNTGWTAADFPADPAPIRDLAVDDDDRILVLHGPLRTILIYEPKDTGKEAI